MADFQPPSFSLGLDFDLDSEPQPYGPIPDSLLNFNVERAGRSSDAATLGQIQHEDDDDDDFETPTTVLDPPVSEPSRPLKRLRRGSTSKPTLAQARKGEPKVERLDVDDEIEEFSSQEDPPRVADNAPNHHHSLGSSSKLPLHGHGVLASQSTTWGKARTKPEVPYASDSADTKVASNRLVFPNLTISPLRRFQLIDSDSEETSLDGGLNNIVNQVDSTSNVRKSNPNQVAAATELNKTKLSVSHSQTEELWKEICPQKSSCIPTPALDEVCDEYFRSRKDKNEFHTSHEGYYKTCDFDKSNVQNCHLGPVPSSHQYYFHDDQRIQKLVRARLPNFLPLGVGSNQGHKQHNNFTIDYMSQFGHGEASKQSKKKQDKEPSSTRSRKRVRKSNVQELSQGSESWVNPRSCAGIPKDAGKRRVHAVGKSASHWYTASNGKRVYVARDGQELTGQIAYRQYRRESGAGSKNSKRKMTSKKKNAAKKK